MRNAILSCLVLTVTAASGVARGDDPWLISEFRQSDQTVVVGGDLLRLTPEAAGSLRNQLELRATQRRRSGGEDGDPRFSATVTLGKDVSGRPIITAIAVH